MSARGKPAAFLDRDGTIMEDRAYVADPDDVVLIPGAAAAITRLNAAGVPVVVVTNQSGIARGYLTSDDYDRVAARMVALLAHEGARIDGSYMCPHHPDLTGPCDCRKPGRLLYEQAAAAMGLDLARSLYAGDRLRDVLPAGALGGLGVLIPTSATAGDDRETATRDFTVVSTLGDAVDLFLSTVTTVRPLSA
ncbi:MAG: hypothetical protein NVS9B3_07470 [Gemmatimonadaceae bacterium]